MMNQLPPQEKEGPVIPHLWILTSGGAHKRRRIFQQQDLGEHVSLERGMEAQEV